MSDVWISRKKWTCKYCNVTINDDAPSRAHHENGMRHKGNVERAVRDAGKNKERAEVEARKAKKEMEKIERLALQSYASDPKAASSWSTPAPLREKPAPPKPWKPAAGSSAGESPLARMLRRQEEANKDTKDSSTAFLGKQGTVGQWQTVSAEPPPSTQSLYKTESPGSGADLAQQNINVPHNEPRGSSFRVREKQGNYGHESDEDDTLSQIKIKKRPRREEKAVQEEREKVPIWKPMRIDTGISVKSEGASMVPVEERSREVVELNEEGGREEVGLGEEEKKVMKEEDSAQPGEEVSLLDKGVALLDERAPSGSIQHDIGLQIPDEPESRPPAAAMFKKRKAGAGAKKGESSVIESLYTLARTEAVQPIHYRPLIHRAKAV